LGEAILEKKVGRKRPERWKAQGQRRRKGQPKEKVEGRVEQQTVKQAW